jgi:hypothetical protein
MPQARVSSAVPAWRPSPPGDGTVHVVFGGVVAGLALPVLYVAWLNRGGPGEVCHTRFNGQECGDAWSPWPFLGVAVLFLVAAAFLLRSGLRARHTATASGADVPSLWLGAGWALVGVLGCFGVLGMLTIGPMILPFALLLAAALAGKHNPLTAGLVAAVAAYPLTVLAVLNRRGPLDACRAAADGGQLCEAIPTPWPFAIGAVVCLGLAAILLARAGRQRRGPSSPDVGSR